MTERTSASASAVGTSPARAAASDRTRSSSRAVNTGSQDVIARGERSGSHDLHRQQGRAPKQLHALVGGLVGAGATQHRQGGTHRQPHRAARAGELHLAEAGRRLGVERGRAEDGDEAQAVPFD
ncbi:hypothetical protein [Nocardioides alcanivorans]|uniref:hypothetical protein n=1 Tax=Nocardioides alcanivorans TaxID=2897352 RepID=UPI001F2097EB|nr:hypothetical protein [Nocardioides alcanivorans]